MGQYDQATLAGGCFWGMEELIRTQPGVINTLVGYTGGQIDHPKYEQVKTGQTGHAEAIQITFDSKIISYAQLLDFFFRIHDPTTHHRQGGDIGSQYRSAIFCHSDEQYDVALKSIKKAQGFWPKPIITEVIKAGPFFPAEDYHQSYLQKNPGGYTCHYFRK
jgi:methionine-S-sulfoxide reductase